MCALPPLLTITLSTQKGKGPLPSFRSNLFSTPLFWEGPFVDLKVCPRPRLWGSQQPGTSHSRWSHCLDAATAMNKETGASLSENSSPEGKARQPRNPSCLVLSSTGKVLGLTSGVRTYPQGKLNDARSSSEKSWPPTLAVLFPQS